MIMKSSRDSNGKSQRLWLHPSPALVEQEVDSRSMTAHRAHGRANVGRLPRFSYVSLVRLISAFPALHDIPISSRFHQGNSRQ